MVQKILLTCMGGFSTSMLVEKMKESAKKRGLQYEIEACGEGVIQQYLPADVVLIGPQMSYAEDEIKKATGGNIPVEIIDMMAYGMMDGEKVLDRAITLMEGKSHESK